MDVEIVITGTEVTNGTIVDTNSSWLAKRLTGMGLVVRRKTAVGDRMDDLVGALRAAAARSEAVIVSGGLGPTSDDLTRAAAARAARTELRFLPAEARRIEARWRARGLTMPASNVAQAYIPRGARIIPNPVGTAPGFEVRIGGVSAYSLPGVPSELQRMFDDTVAPRLARRAGARARLTSREMLVLLLAESVVGERTESRLRGMPGRDDLEIGYALGRGGVIVRLSSRRRDAGVSRTLLQRAAGRVRREFGDLCLPTADLGLEELVARDLLARRTTVAVAESCTGGLVTEMLTRVPGISACLLEGVVAYSNRAKMRRLGVRAATLGRHGAVSAETAREMARGICRTSGARLGIAITGIAGPAGGTPEKPVGLVFVAARYSGKELVEELRLAGQRHHIRLRAAAYALLVARRLLRG